MYLQAAYRMLCARYYNNRNVENNTRYYKHRHEWEAPKEDQSIKAFKGFHLTNSVIECWADLRALASQKMLSTYCLSFSFLLYLFCYFLHFCYCSILHTTSYMLLINTYVSCKKVDKKYILSFSFPLCFGGFLDLEF